jgi:hypothetical protein
LFSLPIKFIDLLNKPSEFFGDLVRKLIIDMIQDPAVWMLKELHKILVVQDPFLFETNLLYWSEIAAMSIATIFFMIRIMNGMKENITGENNANFAEIVGSYLVSVVLIKASSHILWAFLVKISRDLIPSIPAMMFKGSLPPSFDPSQGINGLLINHHYDGWLYILVLLIIAIGILGFLFSAAILHIELGILLIIGPLVATSYQNRSQALRTYWTECIAVVFTQSVQYYLFILMIYFFGQKEQIVWAIATMVVAIRGPQILRQYLHGQGNVPGSGAASTIGRLATFAVVRKI